jgi:hypothetical protein
LTFAEKGAINSFERLTSVLELMTRTIERLAHLEVATRDIAELE